MREKKNKQNRIKSFFCFTSQARLCSRLLYYFRQNLKKNIFSKNRKTNRFLLGLNITGKTTLRIIARINKAIPVTPRLINNRR